MMIYQMSVEREKVYIPYGKQKPPILRESEVLSLSNQKLVLRKNCFVLLSIFIDN